MSSSVLRPMTPADLDELMIVQRVGAVVGLGHIFPQEQFPFPVDVVRRRWEAEIASADVDCFVILDERRVVAGFAAVRGDEFLHFGTAVESWGTGLAGRAHDEVVALWVGCGHRRARLRVFEGNVRARRFYERRGWRPTGDRSVTSFPPHPVLLGYERELVATDAGTGASPWRQRRVTGSTDR